MSVVKLDAKLFADFRSLKTDRRLFRDIDASASSEKQVVYIGVDQGVLASDKKQLQAMLTDLKALQAASKAEQSLVRVYTSLYETTLASIGLLEFGYTTTTKLDKEAFNAHNVNRFGPLDAALWVDAMSFLAGNTEVGKSVLKKYGLEYSNKLHELSIEDSKLTSAANALGLKQLYVDLQQLDTMEDVNKLVSGLHKGWSASVSDMQGHTSIRYRQKQVVLAKNFYTYEQRKQIRILLHEIGVHLTKWSNSQGSLKVVSYGMPGYSRLEEGLASMLASRMTGSYRIKGTIYYAAIGFALGLDGRERNFDEVRKELYELLRVRHTESYSAKMSAQICRRIYRGVDVNTRGCVFIKDKLYLEGAVDVARVFNNSTETEVAKIAKYRYNPTDGSQRAIIDYIINK